MAGVSSHTELSHHPLSPAPCPGVSQCWPPSPGTPAGTVSTSRSWPTVTWSCRPGSAATSTTPASAAPAAPVSSRPCSPSGSRDTARSAGRRRLLVSPLWLRREFSTDTGLVRAAPDRGGPAAAVPAVSVALTQRPLVCNKDTFHLTISLSDLLCRISSLCL